MNDFLKFVELKEQELVEEGVVNANTEKQANLIAKLIGKRLSTKTYRMPGIQKFKNSKGNFSGFLYFYGDTAAFRLNIKKGSKNISSFDSLDVWDDGGSSSIGKPDYCLLFDQININMQIPVIVNFMKKTPKIGKQIEIENSKFHQEGVEYKLNDFVEENVIEEGRQAVEVDGKIFNTKAEAIEYMATELHYDKKQIVQTGVASGPRISAVLKNLGALGTITVAKAVSSKIIEEPVTETLPVYASVDEMYDDLETLTGMVIDGTQNSLLITGMAGIGKCLHGSTPVKVLLDSAA